jgi:hypothetical protein
MLRFGWSDQPADGEKVRGRVICPERNCSHQAVSTRPHVCTAQLRRTGRWAREEEVMLTEHAVLVQVIAARGTVAVSRNPVADQGGTACALSGVCIADVGKEFYARFSAIASLQ